MTFADRLPRAARGDIGGGRSMALGATPLIPMYRILPGPNARFDRFGLNYAQLFGSCSILSTGMKGMDGDRQQCCSYKVFLRDLCDPLLPPR